jgi:hypothetical protein
VPLLPVKAPNQAKGVFPAQAWGYGIAARIAVFPTSDCPMCEQLLAQHRPRSKQHCACPAPWCGRRDPPHRCAFPAERSQALGKFPTAGEHGSHGDRMLRFSRPAKVDLPLFPWSDEHVCHSNMDVCVWIGYLIPIVVACHGLLDLCMCVCVRYRVGTPCLRESFCWGCGCYG